MAFLKETNLLIKRIPIEMQHNVGLILKEMYVNIQYICIQESPFKKV